MLCHLQPAEMHKHFLKFDSYRMFCRSCFSEPDPEPRKMFQIFLTQFYIQRFCIHVFIVFSFSLNKKERLSLHFFVCLSTDMESFVLFVFEYFQEVVVTGVTQESRVVEKALTDILETLSATGRRLTENAWWASAA